MRNWHSPPSMGETIKNHHSPRSQRLTCAPQFMTNLMTAAPVQGCVLSDTVEAMTIHQGDCVNLDSDDATYQVIGVDDEHHRCWVRRWPLQTATGSPVFEISLEHIKITS